MSYENEKLNPYIVATLASIALPKEEIDQVVELQGGDESYIGFELKSKKNHEMVIYFPNGEDNVTKLAVESSIATIVHEEMNLKFRTPENVGLIDITEDQSETPFWLGFPYRAVINKKPTGEPVQPRFYSEEQVRACARMMAEIHESQQSIVESAGLPQFSNQQCREAIVKTLDQAAATGKVPSGLISRWEDFVNDDSVWDFDSRVIHGDIRGQYINFEGNDIVYISGWHSLKIGDPALDLAGITPVLTTENDEAFYHEYRNALVKKSRVFEPDSNLEKRATFYGQLELVELLIEAEVEEETETAAKIAQELHKLEVKVNLSEALEQSELEQTLQERKQAKIEQLRLQQDGTPTEILDREELLSSAEINVVKQDLEEAEDENIESTEEEIELQEEDKPLKINTSTRNKFISGSGTLSNLVAKRMNPNNTGAHKIDLADFTTNIDPVSEFNEEDSESSSE
ncbi:MAG: hypothetical protein LBM13_05930 [Candidatus Ancillula sp.]|jgi:aminoglycoside phosphotransferase (APT) family kinase protein|nr:hypothetical protein [Candidatus Ancillula sp.]